MGSSSPLRPLRGELWWIAFPGIDDHPGLILSVNEVHSAQITVALLSSKRRASSRRIPIGRDATNGLTHPVSYVVATDIFTVPVTSCYERIGMLHQAAMTDVAAAIRLVLGLG